MVFAFSKLVLVELPVLKNHTLLPQIKILLQKNLTGDETLKNKQSQELKKEGINKINVNKAQFSDRAIYSQNAENISQTNFFSSSSTKEKAESWREKLLWLLAASQASTHSENTSMGSVRDSKRKKKIIRTTKNELHLWQVDNLFHKYDKLWFPNVLSDSSKKKAQNLTKSVLHCNFWSYNVHSTVL